VTEERETWYAFSERAISADLDFSDQNDRLIVIDRIIEIIDRFISPTVGAMTVRSQRARPPGGEGYCLEDWLQYAKPFDPDADFEYWETFGDNWAPSANAIIQFLAIRNLQLLNSEDGLKFHHAWIGRSASQCAHSLLIGLQIAVDDRETPQWQAEFARLAPLLDRQLGASLAETLVMTLFRLSTQLGHAELGRPHTAFILSLLEWEARNKPLVEVPHEPKR